MEEPVVRAEVSYRLGEYLSFVGDLSPYVQAARNAGATSGDMHAIKDIPAPGATVPLWRRVLIMPIAALVFFIKRAKVGACRFTIDTEGVTRDSKAGSMNVAWSEVVRVLRLSQCYLVAKEQGAMPIPYRCLSDADRARLEQILAAAGHADL